MPSPYDAAVERNMIHLGTPLHEWTAVPVIGTADATGPGGGKVVLPEFAMPSGYSPAPSLYQACGSEACCELCAHSIKIVYWIQHHGRRWVMAVGSDCITRFQEASGDDLWREAKLSQARALAEQVRVTFRAIAEYRRSNRWSDAYHQAGREHRALFRAVGKLPDLESERATLAWYTAKRATVSPLVKSLKRYLQ